MKIIKRNGAEVEFDPVKIENALIKANDAIDIKSKRITKKLIKLITEEISESYINAKRTRSVEYIQDQIENKLIEYNAYTVAKEYITYRFKRNIGRTSSTVDDKILALLANNNEDIKQENSNKNPVIASTQRDYMAGEVSKHITNSVLLPPDIVEAHNKAIIHFHDSDYFAQQIFNCCLINLEDMLQNGTVISGTLIEKPHSFSTACNIATQIIAQVASNQYGGQTITLSHLAPFVEVSRQKIRKEVEVELSKIRNSIDYTYDSVLKEITEKRVKEEIKRGIQTIQYQVVTLMTTNGQAPFLSVNMYLNEAKNEQEKADLALIIEEMLNQRIQGVKNEKGVWITPAFPKLLYVLEEDNITPDSKYWYLTELAAKCTAKRMVPDYISEKKMKEYKINKNGDGDCYPCMGCVDGNSVITYKYNNIEKSDTFKNFWVFCEGLYDVKHQLDDTDNPNLYINVSNLEILDTKLGWVNCNRLIRNVASNWLVLKLNLDNEIYELCCTVDHEFTTKDGNKPAYNLTVTDEILVSTSDKSNVRAYAYAKVYSLFTYNQAKFSYDVSTDSEHFEVNGIYSHNCRSFLTPYVDIFEFDDSVNFELIS